MVVTVRGRQGEGMKDCLENDFDLKTHILMKMLSVTMYPHPIYIVYSF